MMEKSYEMPEYIEVLEDYPSLSLFRGNYYKILERAMDYIVVERIENPPLALLDILGYKYLEVTKSVVEKQNAINPEHYKKDAINPEHYKKGDIECIEAIKAATGEGFKSYIVGNIIKYIWRFEHKNGLEDVKKAQWYLEVLIKELNK